jgi:hypothetical protein
LDEIAPNISTPFFIHWICGVDPGFTNVAENVTGSPEHTEFVGVEMDIAATWGCSTDMVIEFETTGLVNGQSMPDVSTQDTISLFNGR